MAFAPGLEFLEAAFLDGSSQYACKIGEGCCVS